jgi:hypothetical protein
MKFGNTINFFDCTDMKKMEELCRENAVDSCRHLAIEFQEENYTLHWTTESVTWTYDAH